MNATTITEAMCQKCLIGSIWYTVSVWHTNNTSKTTQTLTEVEL